jgi:hypothetical protein
MKLAKFACWYEFEAYGIVVGRKWIPERQKKLAFCSWEDLNVFHVILLKPLLNFVGGLHNKSRGSGGIYIQLVQCQSKEL